MLISRMIISYSSKKLIWSPQKHQKVNLSIVQCQVHVFLFVWLDLIHQNIILQHQMPMRKNLAGLLWFSLILWIYTIISRLNGSILWHWLFDLFSAHLTFYAHQFRYWKIMGKKPFSKSFRSGFWGNNYHKWASVPFFNKCDWNNSCFGANFEDNRRLVLWIGGKTRLYLKIWG